MKSARIISFLVSDSRFSSFVFLAISCKCVPRRCFSQYFCRVDPVLAPDNRIFGIKSNSSLLAGDYRIYIWDDVTWSNLLSSAGFPDQISDGSALLKQFNAVGFSFQKNRYRVFLRAQTGRARLRNPGDKPYPTIFRSVPLYLRYPRL
jgi:hypothetical protein